MKYFPGNIYVNSAIFSLCNIVAIIVSPFIYEKAGMKMGFFSLFFTSALGGILILTWGSHSKSKWVFPALVLLASSGMSAGFNLIFAVHGQVFSTLFGATAMGICNFAARIATIFAPMVAEIKGPLSMSIFSILCCMSLILSFFITKHSD